MPHRIRHGLRITLIGVLANALLAVGKLVAGIAGHSFALVADAVESFSDVVGAGIVWCGLSVSAKPPDAEHPYGHGKAESLAALAVGALLIGAAVGIAVHAGRSIHGPQDAPAPFTLVVLVVVILVKESLFRLLGRAGRQIDSTALCADAWHQRSDALTSLAAGIGISISVFAGPRYAAADEWAALLASGIIAFNGLRVAHQAAHELMDRQPNHRLLAEVTEAAASVPGVRRIEKVLGRKMGIAYLCDMHVEVDARLPVRQAHDLAHRVKDEVRSRNPQVSDVLVHIEPYPDDRVEPETVALEAHGSGPTA